MAGNPLTVFDCPSCGASVNVRVQGQSLSIVCSACQAIIDAKDERHEIIQKVTVKEKAIPVIPLGNRGVLRGVKWECVGFMERTDGSHMYAWKEYLLFSPGHGYRWLTEFNGHWNYVIPLKSTPQGKWGAGSVTSNNRRYQLFHKGVGIVRYVLGEFYWRVKVGDKVELCDYINPPEVLSVESDRNEKIWSLGEYVPAAEVYKAFQVKDSLPLPIGVAPNQPSPVGSGHRPLLRYFQWLLIAAVLIQIGQMLGARREVVLQQDYLFDTRLPTHVHTTPPFEFKGNRANVLFELTADVDNDWFEIDGEIINDDTGDSVEFEQGVEYYHGYDSDGSWSEGSRANGRVMASVPGGRYHLKFAGQYAGGRPQVPFRVKVTRDVVNWSNFFVVVFLLCLPPIWSWWRRRSFEVTRWSSSDYSPYWSSED